MSVVQSSPPARSEPAWEIARLFPDQGRWTESDYLSLTENLNSLVELSDGRIEVLPMPTAAHQNIAFFLLTVLRAFITPRRLGFAMPAPFRVRLGQDRFREPDVRFMLRENSARMSNEFWNGADLVMEVVSPDPKDRDRDLQTKRGEYAKAGVAEYWVVDPEMQRVTVLRLMGGKYKMHVEGKPGGRVGSALLKGFKLSVDEIFAAAEFPD